MTNNSWDLLISYNYRTTNKNLLKLKHISPPPKKKKEVRKLKDQKALFPFRIVENSFNTLTLDIFWRLETVVCPGWSCTTLTHRGHPEHATHTPLSVLSLAVQPSRLFIFILIMFVNRRRGREEACADLLPSLCQCLQDCSNHLCRFHYFSVEFYWLGSRVISY